MKTFQLLISCFLILSINKSNAQYLSPLPNSSQSSVCAATITNSSVQNASCFNGNNGSIDITVGLDTTPCRSNTVALNEIMHKPLLNNGINPNAGEYLEIIAPAGTNIGCYVLTDGDWTITLPQNTIVPADGLFSIGNNVVYGAGSFDLDAENCNCFTDGSGGGGLLILTDAGEYISLFNNIGVFVQGLQYGSPTSANTPPNGNLSISGTINTIGLAGCPAQVTIPSPAAFSTISAVANTGDSYQRSPDGNGNWTIPIFNTINQCNTPSNAVYSVVWSNGVSTEDVSNLNAGFYSVTVSDGNGCQVLESFTVTQPTQVTVATVSLTNTSCGSNNGAIQINVGGGTAGNYNSIWSNGNTGFSINNLSAGVYNATITDANRCIIQYSQTISNPAAPTITLTSTNILCNGDATGTATINTTGGTQPIIFSWSNGETSNIASGLVSNNYVVTVTDALGCIASANISISEPTQLTADNIQTIDVNCFGLATGQASLTASGGVPSYTFAWSNGQTGRLLQNVVADSYTVTVGDANGCSTVRFLDILQPTLLTFAAPQILTDSISCDLEPTGAVGTTILGGTNPYTYIWDNTTQTTANISGLAAGDYLLTVTDANGCAIFSTFEVFAPVTISVTSVIDSFNSQNATIFIGQTIDLNVVNPIPSQTYTWALSPNNGGLIIIPSIGNDIGVVGNTSGRYNATVSATSINGCTASDTLLIDVISPFLGMPTAFSPNGDNTNELFRPISLDAQYIKDFKIFNRWGGILYDSPTLVNGGWNGSYKDEAQSKDVYIYTLTYQLPNQTEIKTLRGEFTLIR